MSKGWRIFWKTVLFFALGALFNIFGLIAWLIIFFCWKGDDDYQKLYYKDAYEKQKHEDEEKEWDDWARRNL